jgi:hypothetical protein
MNKKLILICICALALTCAGLQALAQDKPDQPAPQTPGSQTNPQPSTDSSQTHVSDADTSSMVDARLQQLTTELGLSDDQRSDQAHFAGRGQAAPGSQERYDAER